MSRQVGRQMEMLAGRDETNRILFSRNEVEEKSQ
jgi:hypothetical protein